MKIQITNRGQFIACILAFFLTVFAIFTKNHNTDVAMTVCFVAIFLNFYWTIKDKMWMVGFVLGSFISCILWFIYITMNHPKDNVWYPHIGVWVAVAVSFFLTIVILSNFIETVKRLN